MKNSPPKVGAPTGSSKQPAGDFSHTQKKQIIREDALQRKRFATLAARAALAGHTLTQVTTGYMLSKWSHSKHAPDLDTIEVLLTRMGARK
jgi:hypothetical protein